MMSQERSQRMKEHPVLEAFARDVQAALGPRLRSVVLYGSAARGDFQEAASDFNVIVVVVDLGPATLEALSPAVARWRRKGQPAPRLFSPALIAESADVFPIEFLDLKACREVIHGEDPFAGVEVRRDFLRLQCERELREKLMRLREAYVEAHGRPKDLRRLRADSYTPFVALFRGCLYPLGAEGPLRNADVVAAFCAKAELDHAAFEAVDRLQRGGSPSGELKSIFSRYYDELGRAVGKVDRFDARQGGRSQ